MSVGAASRLIEEYAAGPARLRVDRIGGEPRQPILEDTAFLEYRLAEVSIAPEVRLPEPDLEWRIEEPQDIGWDGRRMTLRGAWPPGPIEKVIVALLALRMEALGLHPFHSSAVRYRDRTICPPGSAGRSPRSWTS